VYVKSSSDYLSLQCFGEVEINPSSEVIPSKVSIPDEEVLISLFPGKKYIMLQKHVYKNVFPVWLYKQFPPYKNIKRRGVITTYSTATKQAARLEET
jgi:hypothetical protein